MSELPVLHTQVLNSLEDQVAVIDENGVIVDVNTAWRQFGIENGLSEEFTSIGCNYLDVCSNPDADTDNLAHEARKGMADVIEGKLETFYYEYPCHSPTEQRWYMMRITRVKGTDKRFFVVSHQDITQRKLAEETANQLAMLDPLTGLGNRRYFKRFLEREFQRSVRNQSAITLVEVDVDHFKEYNDQLGHPAGDECLIQVGQVLRDTTRRPGDLAVRLGGDEFALILSDTDAEGSKRVSEIIRKSISDLGLVYDGSRILTVSVGAASMVPHEQQTWNALLDEADKALYRAKSAGRNRVFQAQPAA
jgi:diguanylate cyclase (GGDEF)-like protein/PAS domain S-box-containing protein